MVAAVRSVSVTPASASRLLATVVAVQRPRQDRPIRAEALQHRKRDSGVAARRTRGRGRCPSRPILAPSWSHSASPFFQRSASCSAAASRVLLRLDLPLVQPGCEITRGQVGKRQEQIGEVALGSMARTGIWSSADSSMTVIPRPVFPLPVMPMQTAWVTRSRDSYRTGSFLRVLEPRSNRRPR